MMVTQFHQLSATKVELTGPLHFDALCQVLLHHTEKNSFVAVKVEGEFESIHCRAVNKQRGNRPLIEVAKEQALFDFGPNEHGTLVGFWSPSYIGCGLNVPGFHLHYISDDKKRGGHVLGVVLVKGEAYLQPIHHLEQDIPQFDEFQEADLMKRDAETELDAAEGAHT